MEAYHKWIEIKEIPIKDNSFIITKYGRYIFAHSRHQIYIATLLKQWDAKYRGRKIL